MVLNVNLMILKDVLLLFNATFSFQRKVGKRKEYIISELRQSHS